METIAESGVYSTSLGSFDSKPPPLLPARSPLRPRTSALVQTAMNTRTFIVSAESMQLIQGHRLSDLSGGDVSDKKLSVLLPESPSPLSSVDIDDEGSSTSSILNAPPARMSKRTHALLELLSSERAYASDLALIRDIHIPLALGHPSPFMTPNATSHSSSSSSRTLSTASDSSTKSNSTPAMTKDDARIIFNNISDLALFADAFTDRLEDALGSVLDGGQGQDRAGALFLEMIPAMEPLYQHYITRHPTALEHLNKLPQTPSLSAYLQYTRTLASSLSHAWDLPSLLIKPVQRLLKYSLLLNAIIDGTPDDHDDKKNLRIAKEKMDEVARGVNEGRRRREVVKEVLTGGDTTGAKKKGLNVGVAASVRLGNMKGIRNAAKTREGFDGNEEKEQVLKMEAELKHSEAFIRRYAKEVVDWAREMKEMMSSLSSWTESFGRVIGISEDQVSESFDAFRMVVDRQILPLCDDLEMVIKERMLSQLAVLVDTMLPPSRLLEAMHTLEPLHYGLLNLNVSKSRPPPALLEASKSYVALRAQLHVELPQYLALLHKGIVAAILQLGVWQGQFWEDVRARWGELWEALKVDGETGVGSAPETVSIWWQRFSVIDVALAELDILKKAEKLPTPKSTPSVPRTPQQERFFVPKPPKETPRSAKESSRSPPPPPSINTSRVMSILASLEPSAASTGYIPPKKSATVDDVPRRKNSRRASDASRRSRRDSLPPGADFDSFLGTSPTSPSTMGYFLDPRTDQVHAVPIQRRSTSNRTMIVDQLPPPPPTPPIYTEPDRPRSHSQKPSMRRKLTEGFRNSTSSTNSASSSSSQTPAAQAPATRRTPSLPTLVKSKSRGRTSSPAPSMPSRPTTPYATPIMYECEAITSFNVGRDIKYEGIAFHVLRVGNRLGIMQEAGHPSTHANLPISVDDGEDCLLLARNIEGTVGWAFASFLLPVD